MLCCDCVKLLLIKSKDCGSKIPVSVTPPSPTLFHFLTCSSQDRKLRHIFIVFYEKPKLEKNLIFLISVICCSSDSLSPTTSNKEQRHRVQGVSLSVGLFSSDPQEETSHHPAANVWN